jgi:hypothetical protein
MDAFIISTQDNNVHNMVNGINMSPLAQMRLHVALCGFTDSVCKATLPETTTYYVGALLGCPISAWACGWGQKVGWGIM